MADTPKIRFKGFTDDWEQRKVTDLGEIYIGLVTTMTAHYTDHGTLLIRNSDIKDSHFEYGDNPIYLDEDFAKQNSSKKHKLGDVITVHTGDIGTSAVITEKEAGSIGFATIVTRPNLKKITSDFLCAYLNTDIHKKFALRISTGDGRNNYNLKDYYECVIPIPNIKEQKKISYFIETLNNLITLHQRKCDEIKELKKYMLQKMFPKKDQKVPEIRFAGFTGDWKRRKLGKIAEFNPKSELPDKFEYVDLESVVGTEIVSHRTETKSSAPSRAQRLARKGDIFYQMVRPYQKNNYLFSRSDNNYVFSTGYAQIRPYIDAEFLFSFLQTEGFVKVVLDNCTGTSYPAINSTDLSNLMIILPLTKDEQAKIGKYMLNLDHLITLHQRKCDELKEVKKFMLQNMFPQKK